MPDATWPTTVPAEPELGSYSEIVVSNLGSATLGGALPSAAQRSTIKGTRIRGTWVLTAAELGNFQAFFATTTAGGARPFAWVNPAYGVTGRYLFDPDEAPEWVPIGYGSLYQLRLSLLKLR